MISSLPIETRDVPCLRIDEMQNISFAHYWQPDEEQQWAYDIEWKAIKSINGAVLLVSKEGLYCKPLDIRGGENWKDSSLRKWLNEEWIQNSFRYGHENLVVPVSSDTPLEVPSLVPYSMPKEGFREKREGEDYVFLLSVEEIKELLPESSYCLEPHWIADRSSIKNPHFVKWWTRTEKSTDNNCISEAGLDMHCDPDAENVFVRPALWLDNFYIKRLHMDAVREWEWLVRDVKDNKFDFSAFKHAAVSAHGILYLYSGWVDDVISCPKFLMELAMLIARFSEIHLDNETEDHQLALIIADRLCNESIHWTTIYQHNPGPGQPGSLKNGFILRNLEGEVIILDATTFDIEHPFDKEKLVEEGYFIL